MVYLLTNLLVFVRVLGWDFKGLNLYNRNGSSRSIGSKPQSKALVEITLLNIVAMSALRRVNSAAKMLHIIL